VSQKEEGMKTTFIYKVNDYAPAIGTIVTLETPDVAEMLSLCGFDWLFIDMEHGPLSPGTTQHIIQAVGGECSSIVRVPENSEVWIKKALDTGCDGVIVPQVKSAEDARLAVSATKFPPQGSRSVGIARAHGYGMSFTEYVASANEKVALVILIEHIDAVSNLEEILAVRGIDGVLIGPYDLSGSMNMLGQVTSEPVRASVAEIKKKCQEKSVPVGMFVMNAEDAQQEIDDGCKFIVVGIDSVLLWNAAKNALDTVLKSSRQ
jgi:2-keto-3-deoxy-L-rhamnonate aldolase RhmA